MEQDVQEPKSYKKELLIGAGVVAGIVAVVTAIALTVYNGAPRIVYEPAKACDLFNSTEAKTLLGDKMIRSTMTDPKLSGDMGTSACGYTNGNPDMDNVIVAAINVRSGINDKGVEQNKTEFATGKSIDTNEPVKDLGDSAYFNTKLGQLNVLEDRKWIILSYGVATAPETNTVEKAIELAKLVVKSSSKKE